jgi:hypothetical protein
VHFCLVYISFINTFFSPKVIEDGDLLLSVWDENNILLLLRIFCSSDAGSSLPLAHAVLPLLQELFNKSDVFALTITRVVSEVQEIFFMETLIPRVNTESNLHKLTNDDHRWKNSILHLLKEVNES